MERLHAVQRHLASAVSNTKTSNNDEDNIVIPDISAVLDAQTGVGHFHLTRPKALNALNTEMVNVILRCLHKWTNPPRMSVLLISGDGRALCAGGDIRNLACPPTPGWAEEFFRKEYTMNYALATLNVPSVAIMQGVTMGGGVGISVHGKYRVATDNTNFAMPETGIGLFPDVGGCYFLPRLPGPYGNYLALTGSKTTGADARFLGVATHFVPLDRLAQLISDIKSGAGKNDVCALLDKYATIPENAPLEQQRPFIERSFANVASVEEVFERLARQCQVSDESEAQWAKKTLALLQSKSITSMLVTFEAIKRGKTLSLKEVLKQDFRIAVRTAQAQGDFKEGVRALIIDKDNKPKWRPAPSHEEVLRYFAPLQVEKDGQAELEL